MDKSLKSLDWSLIQSFVAVAETGSLSAAARETRQSQPTVGRHIKTIEHQLDVLLFTRIPRGLELTEAGEKLLAPAKQMALAASQFTLTAGGQSSTIKGVVRITASTFVSHHILPDIIAEIRNLEPEIQLEIVPSDTTENLLFREADIALRMYRPKQLDMISKHICDIDIGLYASHEYIDKYGVPETIHDLEGHTFVGMDRSEFLIRSLREYGMVVNRDFFSVRCDDQVVFWELVRAGCGIGACQRNIADKDTKVVEILKGLLLKPLQVWLTAHQDLRSSPRIRRVYDLLEQGMCRAVKG